MTTPEWLEDLKRFKAEAENWWGAGHYLAEDIYAEDAAYILALVNHADELIAALERESREWMARVPPTQGGTDE